MTQNFLSGINKTHIMLNKFIPLKFIFSIIAAGVFLLTASAQTSQDSINIAVKLKEAGKHKESLAILVKLYSDHPSDLYVTWYYAQFSGISGDFQLSYKLYENAIHLQPENMAIQLDYGKTLVNAGEVDKAEWMLNSVLEKDKNNVEAWYYLGKVYYWQGRFNESEKLLSNLDKTSPGRTDAAILLEQVRGDIAPWVQVQASLSHDDQPLNILNPGIKGGKYFSSLLCPDFELNTPYIRVKNKNYFFQGFKAGNTFHFRKAGTKLYLSAGVFDNSEKQKLFITGDFRIEKTLLKKLILSTEFQRIPYYFTKGSLDAALMENHFSASLEWNNPNKWNGKLNFEHGIFSSDQQSVSAYSGWVFAPKVMLEKFDFHFGYGFNFSNSDVNNFTATRTIEKIVNSGNSTSALEGEYNPYFTPRKQQIHSLLVTMNTKISKSFSLKVGCNLGIYAKSLYPYLYLDKNSDDDYYIAKGFDETKFNPFEIKTHIDLKLTKSLLFSTDLNYFHSIYYSGEMIRLSLKKSF
jgi:tetratricopeptide (TPR) repeat protein